MKLKILATIAIVIGITLAAISQDQKIQKTNDRAYINGNIITMEKGSTAAEAMLVSDGKISAVGTNKEILAFKPEDTEIYDLNNQVVLPGFIDSHSHVALSSFFIDMVDLSGFTHNSNQEVWEHLRNTVKTKRSGEWIVGRGIDSVLVDDLELPTLKFLDKIAPKNPIILISQSMHTYWANSSAFKAVGITKETKAPSESSFFGKDADGELNGIIIEQEAFLPILEELKKQLYTPKDLVKASVKTFKAYARNGNTSVVTAGLSIDNKKPLRLYEHISSESTSLMNKVLSFAGILPSREANPRHFIYIRHDKLFLMPEEKQDDDFYNILGVKHWYDGSPYTGSMYLKEPYKKSDLSQIDLQLSEDHRGKALVSEDDMVAFIKKFHNSGWQIAIHSQGDQANEEVLAAFEKTGLDFSFSRHRLEHCVLLSSSSMAKLKQLNILPNFHINHLLYYGEALKNDLLGAERAERILAVGSASEAGLKFSLHADQPMFESKPFRLIQTAVERKTIAGNVIGAGQRISILQAIQALTINAAYLINMENKIGSLKQGKYADFIIVDQNPFETPVSKLEQIKVLKTFVNGNEVIF